MLQLFAEYSNFMEVGINFLMFIQNRNFNTIIRGSLNKFPDFFHMGTFIDSTHMKL